MGIKEKVPFKLIAMPCCQYQVCWVNPRLPTYCPGCGKSVYADLKFHPEGKILTQCEAWLEYKVETGR